MARFEYRRMSLETLTAIEGGSLLDFCDHFSLTKRDVSAWTGEGVHVPHWVVIAVALRAKYNTRAQPMPNVRGCLNLWNAKEVTLARLLGYNPTTVQRWLTGRAPVPRYLPALLGMMKLPGAMSEVRKVTAEWIVRDLKNPEAGDYPFLKSRQEAASHTSEAAPTARVHSRSHRP